MTGLEPEIPSFLAFGVEMPEYLQNKKPQLWLICSSKDLGGGGFLSATLLATKGLEYSKNWTKGVEKYKP